MDHRSERRTLLGDKHQTYDGLKIYRAQLQETLLPGKNAKAILQYWDGAQEGPAATPQTVQVYDLHSQVCAFNGEFIHVWQMPDMYNAPAYTPGVGSTVDWNRFETLHEHGLTRHGKLTSALVPGGSATVALWSVPYGDSSESGAADATVTGWDWLQQAGQPVASGGQCTLTWDYPRMAWYFLGFQQLGIALVKYTGGSDWTIGTSATCDFYGGTPGSETSLSISLPVWNKFGTIPAGPTWVWANNNGYGWYAVSTAC